VVELEHLEREFCIDNLLVRIHSIIEMIWWTGLAPREFELFVLGSLTSTFLGTLGVLRDFLESSGLHSRNGKVGTMTSCVAVKKSQRDKQLRRVSEPLAFLQMALIYRKFTKFSFFFFLERALKNERKPWVKTLGGNPFFKFTQSPALIPRLS
jgi:hypothetical protein